MSQPDVIEGLYEYDFDFSIRSDEHFSQCRPQPAVDAVIARVPGVSAGESGAFLWATPAGLYMEIRAEHRRPDGATGTRTPNGDQVNCVHLFIPARARSASLEKAYFEFAVALAEKLGWTLYDDTDSGCVVDRRTLGAAFPESKEKAPWWKLW
jgi:hypothetical protein